jgi:hypothetical protein
VARACNPIYTGGRDQDYGSRPTWAKISEDPISTNKSVEVHACHPGIKRRTGVQAALGMYDGTYLKNT